ncbi:hypothetical protein [Aurantiacibacter spongiae]|uniref:Uncharacterized protein n=1 Tax=Aurantiacibacter spongiae TaxID=2488860 RepID=A0A3N5CSL5_9SPHN|nr:hypothetical protein [Aurantiacibacter spongiae]RPF72153.1 hypothetical protein EG799_11370 [Aurantiacibacter spongiae]
MASFDPERLLAALPSLPLRPPGPKAPRSFLKWRWPPILPYMGFTPVERVQHWQIARWLIAAGCITVPTHCAICASTDKVGFHSENYYSVLCSPALCGLCHQRLHRRFSRPAAWRDLMQAHVRTGDEWFALIPAIDYDLAGYLRATRGEQLRDMRADPALFACYGIADKLPRNLHGIESAEREDRQGRLL